MPVAGFLRQICDNQWPLKSVVIITMSELLHIMELEGAALLLLTL
jgi:hypothetical protein